MNPLVLYHDNCNDGLTAAWCVMDAYRSIGQSVDLVGVRYGRPPPDVTGRQVIMVDFCYDRPVLLEMLGKAERIEVYDHHKTSQEQLAGLEHPNLYVEFDMERSGAGIAWDAFHPDYDSPGRHGLPRPWFVDYVEDNDLWHHKLPDCKAIMEFIRTIPASRQMRAYDVWMQGPVQSVPPNVVQEGHACLEAKRRLVEQSLDFAHEEDLFGERVWVANVPFFLSSEVAHELVRQNRVGVTYYQKSDGYWGLSFRSTDGKSAAEFALKAKALPLAKDGGGHGNSAGATVAVLPWDDDFFLSVVKDVPDLKSTQEARQGWHVHFGTGMVNGRIIASPSQAQVFDPDGKEVSKYWRGVTVEQKGDGIVIGKLEVVVTKVTSGLEPQVR